MEITGLAAGILSRWVAAAGIAAVARRPRRHRLIPFEVVLRDVQALAKKIESDRAFRPEAVVAISRSGAIVGGMLVGLLKGLAIQAPLVMAIDVDRPAQTRKTRITSGPPNIADFRKIILVTCTNDTGEAMREAIEWIAVRAPSTEVRTAAVYSRTHAVFRPDHVGREAGRKEPDETARLLIGMPWMIDGWNHDLESERRAYAARK
ncbi:phosphoribosyltransferase [Krasilnikovia sp. MM14-A1259]|uniref:phosphoribosyltransferase n=1 Tax=Krasilnikovia sp. MM14-A1259 TaxID=3373539 RepID=UPI0037FE4632